MRRLEKQLQCFSLVHIQNEERELCCASLQFMFDRPYNRTLEAEADKVGLQLAAKVTTACLFY